MTPCGSERKDACSVAARDVETAGEGSERGSGKRRILLRNVKGERVGWGVSNAILREEEKGCSSLISWGTKHEIGDSSIEDQEEPLSSRSVHGHRRIEGAKGRRTCLSVTIRWRRRRGVGRRERISKKGKRKRGEATARSLSTAGVEARHKRPTKREEKRVAKSPKRERTYKNRDSRQTGHRRVKQTIFFHIKHKRKKSGGTLIYRDDNRLAGALGRMERGEGYLLKGINATDKNFAASKGGEEDDTRCHQREGGKPSSHYPECAPTTRCGLSKGSEGSLKARKRSTAGRKS